MLCYIHCTIRYHILSCSLHLYDKIYMMYPPDLWDKIYMTGGYTPLLFNFSHNHFKCKPGTDPEVLWNSQSLYEMLTDFQTLIYATKLLPYTIHVLSFKIQLYASLKLSNYTDFCCINIFMKYFRRFANEKCH